MVELHKASKSQEHKHQQEEAFEFKAMARRNKLAGLWAAGLLGLGAAEADDYAKTVIHADFEEKGDEDVVRKLAKDLAGKADEAAIRQKLADLLPVARQQLSAENP